MRGLGGFRGRNLRTFQILNPTTDSLVQTLLGFENLEHWRVKFQRLLEIRLWFIVGSSANSNRRKNAPEDRHSWYLLMQHGVSSTAASAMPIVEIEEA